jgi:hypothetical protein
MRLDTLASRPKLNGAASYGASCSARGFRRTMIDAEVERDCRDCLQRTRWSEISRATSSVHPPSGNLALRSANLIKAGPTAIGAGHPGPLVSPRRSGAWPTSRWKREDARCKLQHYPGPQVVYSQALSPNQGHISAFPQIRRWQTGAGASALLPRVRACSS